MAFQSSMTEAVIQAMLQHRMLEVLSPDEKTSGEPAVATGTTAPASAIRSRLSVDRIVTVLNRIVTIIQERQALINTALSADPQQASEADRAMILDYVRTLRALLILLELRSYAYQPVSTIEVAAKKQPAIHAEARVIALLIKGLQSNWWHASKLSEQLLRRIDAATPALIAELKNPSRSHRKVVFELLKKLAESAAPAIPMLIEMLTDESEDREDIIEVLGAIGPSASHAVHALLQFITRDDDLVVPAFRALYNIGESAIPGLRYMLQHSPERLRWRAIRALNANLEAAAKALEISLQDDNVNVRFEAAMHLVEHGLAKTPGVLETLLSYNGSPRDSEEVARALARISSQGNLEKENFVAAALVRWIQLHGSKSPEIQDECINALFSLGKPMPDEVIPVLLEQIRTFECRSREIYYVITNLAQYGVVAVPYLIDFLEQSPDRLETIFDVFIAIGPPAALQAIPIAVRCLKEHSNSSKAAHVLKTMGAQTPEAVAVLVDLLNDSYFGNSHIAAEALAELPQPIAEAPSVVELLLQGKLYVSHFLDHCGAESDKILSILVGQIRNSLLSAEDRTTALSRLTALAHRSVPIDAMQLEAVVAALADEALEVRDAAADLLAILAKQESSFVDRYVDQLIAYVKQPDARFLGSTLKMLGEVQSDEAIAAAAPVLLAFATEREPNLQAIESLVRIGAPLDAPLISVLEREIRNSIDENNFHCTVPAAVMGHFGRIHGPDLVAPFVQSLISQLGALNSIDPEERTKRFCVAKTLGAIGSPAADEAIPALMTCMLDPDSDPRCAAARALAQIGTPAIHVSVPMLIGALLVDDHEEVRDSAAEGLGVIGAPAANVAVPALINAIESKYRYFEYCDDIRWDLKCKYHPDPRAPILALGKIGAPATSAAIPTLIRGLLDKRYAQGQNPAPWFIAEALSLIGSPLADAAIPALIHTMDSDSFHAIEAANTLTKLSSPAKQSAIPALLRHLNNDDPRLRTNVCRALGSMGDAAQHCLLQLRKCLEDRSWHVRRAASDAINNIEYFHAKETSQ